MTINGASLPSLDDLQAAANARHAAEIAQHIGQLTLDKTSAEALVNVWRDQATRLQAAYDGAASELAAANSTAAGLRADVARVEQEAAHNRDVAANVQAELNALKAAQADQAAARAARRRKPA